MKIGLISTTIYPLKYPFEGYAGIEKLVSEKAVELQKLGNEVTVFCPIGSKLPEGITIVETIAPTIHYNYIHEKESAEKVMEYVRKNHLDIIEDNTHQKYIYIHGKELSSLNIKLCAVLHDQCNFNSPAPGVPYMNLIGISDSHCNEASAILGIHLEKVYNGVNINNYIYDENKDDYFVFLSRISRFKGAHEAIQLAKMTGVKLYIAGEDVFVNDPQYVFQIMNSCNGQNIIYLGNITEQRKKELLSKAKALIFPLLWNEPFGIVAIEAMASGTPVITYPRGAMPEIVQHRKTGFFCQNIGEIRSAIGLVKDISPKDCLERAKEFSTENMTKNFEKLYQKILDGYEW